MLFCISRLLTLNLCWFSGCGALNFSLQYPWWVASCHPVAWRMVPAMPFALLPLFWINTLKCFLGGSVVTLSCKRDDMFWPNWLLSCWGCLRSTHHLCDRWPVVYVTGRTGWSVGVGCVPRLPSLGSVSDLLWYVHWVGLSHLRCGSGVHWVGLSHLRCVHWVGLSHLRCVHWVGLSHLRCVHWVGLSHLRCGSGAADSLVLTSEYFSIVKQNCLPSLHCLHCLAQQLFLLEALLH
jgi:hypothetical protein